MTPQFNISLLLAVFIYSSAISYGTLESLSEASAVLDAFVGSIQKLWTVKQPINETKLYALLEHTDEFFYCSQGNCQRGSPATVFEPWYPFLGKFDDVQSAGIVTNFGAHFIQYRMRAKYVYTKHSQSLSLLFSCSGAMHVNDDNKIKSYQHYYEDNDITAFLILLSTFVPHTKQEL